jgi:secondary thiamine-phosphate synthase enzyme
MSTGSLWAQSRLVIDTHGRGTYEITAEVERELSGSGIEHGLAHLFVHHTSASLIICENADPAVRSDLEAFMAREVPDGDPLFRHVEEGPDDMPAHIRSILTQTSLTVPVTAGRLALGTWQGIYLWEHRTRPHRRALTVTVNGSPR